jgi:hypothetical protein
MEHLGRLDIASMARLNFDSLVTRAHIRAPFDGKIISLNTRLLNTIDNVKAKIDNVKAKTQDEED